MTGKPLDVTQTTLLKGVGILAIVGHNFQYLVSDLPGVNEFVFEKENFDRFLSGLTLLSFPRLFLAFFGHYGVQLFIFLSAYGLTLSFQKRVPAYGPFVLARLQRLYPAFVLAIVAWALWKGVPRGAMGPVDQLIEHGPSVLLKLTLFSNLVRGEQLSLVGPWWFLPFIFQFYLLFPLLFRLPTRGLAVVGTLGLALTFALNETVLPGGFLLATPLGHLPEFCVGIWWAKHPGARVPGALTVVALLTFVAGNLESHAWYLSHLCVLTLGLASWPFVSRVLVPFQKPLLVIGGLSMQLFLLNGFLRAPFFAWAKAEGTEIAAYSWGLTSLTTCMVFALGLRWLESKVTPNAVAKDESTQTRVPR